MGQLATDKKSNEITAMPKLLSQLNISGHTVSLDVVWGEDESRIRKGNAAENVALLRKMALNLLKNDTSIKGSIRSKRLRASFNNEMLGKSLKLKDSK